KPQTVTVTGVDDLVDDGNVSYKVTLGPAVSADAKYHGLDPADVTISNTDNDTAGVLVTPTSGLTTSESGGKASFTVSLKSKPVADVTIAVASSNTAEGVVSVSKLTFTASNWDQPQTVTIT